MATPEQLCKDGKLVPIPPEELLGPEAQYFRAVYMMPNVESWIDEKLYELKSDKVAGGKNSPAEQLFDHFSEFVAGTDISKSYWHPKRIRPTQKRVWELRTPDLRVFGWFWRKGIYVVSCIDTAARCKDLNLYSGYREQCVRHYLSLNLDPPPAIEGDEADVL